MKRLKQIFAIAMISMMTVVFMPMVPGANGVAEAADAEFYAVFNTAAEGAEGQAGYKPANTLSFYYDANKASHEGVTGKTVYANLPTEATAATDWPYGAEEANIRKSVADVVIAESVKDYKGLKSTAYMFSDMTGANNISGCEYLDVSNVTNMSSTFVSFAAGYSKTYSKITVVPDVANWETGNVTDMSKMFYGYANYSYINAVPDVSKWDTSKVASMSGMFQIYAQNSTKLASSPNVSNWKTGKVTDMSNMFYNYARYSTVLTAAPDVSKWDTSEVVNMSYLFANYAYSSESITAVPDVSNWKTGSVTNMKGVFRYYANHGTGLTAVPNVEKWDTSKVTSMSSMFEDYDSYSTALAAVPNVANWDTREVKDMSNMFKDFAYSSTVITAVPDVSKWVTSNVTSMANMFSSYALKTTNKLDPLDLSGWDISSLETITDGKITTEAAKNMFYNYNAACSSGNPIVLAADWSKAKATGATGTDMFTGSKLKNADKVAAKEDQWSFANTGADGCFTAAQTSVNYINADGATKTCKMYTEVASTTDPVTWNEGWYVVNSDVTISEEITCSGAVHLILVDGKTLTASKGITCTGGANSFAVYGQSSGTGELIAVGLGSGAGIGGGDQENGSNITINGGTVNATGGDDGAGIGGAMDKNGSNITINGGTVTATGGNNGAGIGGGGEGIGSNITINGGTVIATGGVAGVAGIGNGKNADEPAGDIYVADSLVVRAGDAANPTTELAHTSTQDIASDLVGKRYVTVKIPDPVASITTQSGTTKYATVQDAVDAATEGQTVKMLSDVDLTATIDIAAGKKLTLDLNGKTLDGKNLTASANKGDKASVIYVNSGATLTLNDSSTGDAGKITGGKGSYPDCTDSIHGGGGVYNLGTLNIYKISITGNNTLYGIGVCNMGTLNMYSGEISDNKDSAEYVNSHGGGVCNAGTFTMKGGKISGNTVELARAGGEGAGVYNVGTFTMEGGEISGNKGKSNGAGVYNSGGNALFTMKGGKISGNISKAVGGGVTNTGKPSALSTFVMEGGEISGNTGEVKTGGVSNSGSMTVSGASKITGNTSGAEGSKIASNLSGKAITIGTSGLKTGAKIGVTLSSGTGAFTTNGAQTDKAYFTSDNQAYKVKFVPATTGESAVAAHLELVNYDLGQIASDTTSITLDDDDMTLEQAIAIAKAQMPNTGLSKGTFIAYAKADDFATSSKYKTIYASPEVAWDEGFGCTLTVLKSGVSTTDIYVIGTVTNHTHSFTTYTADTTNKTITATCSASDCGLADTKVTATLAAADKEYTGEAYTGASITNKTAWDDAGAADLSLKYKGRGDTSYTESTTAPIAIGKYTVTMTGSGKSVSADFEITKKKLTVNGTTIGDKTYNGNKNADVTAGTLVGVLDGDTVTIESATGSFAEKNVGEGNTVTVSYKLTGADAGKYTVEDEEIEATIDPMEIIVKPDSNQCKEYNWVDPELTYTTSDVIEGETAAFDGALGRETGESVKEGGYKINIGTLAAKDNDAFKAQNYTLKLDETSVYFMINKSKVTVPDVKEGLIYNGKKQTGVQILFNAPYKLTGHTATDAGEHTATLALKNTSNYEWDLETPTSDNQEIKWTIAKRKVTLTSASDSKVYNGTPLTNDEVTVSGDGWLDGEGASYVVTGVQTEVGSSKNTFSYNLNEGTKEGNYEVTKKNGVLTVTSYIAAQGKAGNKSIFLSWSTVSGAKKYAVYLGKCSSKSKCKKVKTTSSKSFTMKNLKRKTSYRCYVVALDKNGKQISKTCVMHIKTTGGKYSNATKVTAKSKLTLTEGKTANVKAKIAKKDSKKPLVNHVKPLRYYSADKSIATVDTKGNVKAKRAGTVKIYSVSPSGVNAMTTVTVQKESEPN